MGTRTSEAQKEQIANMLMSGAATARQIAKEVEVDLTTVYRIAREFEIPMRGGERVLDQLPEDQVEQLLKDYQRGVPATLLCSQIGITTVTFYTYLRSLGISVRTQDVEYLEANKFRMDVAVDMYQQGWVLWFIDDETGIDPVTMAHELHKRGLPLRGRGAKGRIPARLSDGRFILKGTEDHKLWIERQIRLNASRVSEYVDQEEATQIERLFLEAYTKVMHALPPIGSPYGQVNNGTPVVSE